MATRRGTSGNVKRPAQGAHTADRYPKTTAAGGTNERVIKGSRNNNNRKRGYAS